jgi:hypothetical protein
MLPNNPTSLGALDRSIYLTFPSCEPVTDARSVPQHAALYIVHVLPMPHRQPEPGRAALSLMDARSAKKPLPGKPISSVT